MNERYEARRYENVLDPWYRFLVVDTRDGNVIVCQSTTIDYAERIARLLNEKEPA